MCWSLGSLIGACKLLVWSSSLTRDWTRATCIGSMETKPLNHQRSPSVGLFMFCCCCLVGFGFFVCFWPWCSACRILVPWPGIELRPWQWKLRVLITGFPGNSQYYLHFIDKKTESPESKSLVQVSRVQNDQSRACTYSQDSNRRPMLLLRHPRLLGRLPYLTCYYISACWALTLAFLSSPF